ncbi:MAG: ribosome biogenesis GTPase Der [Planctomycetota bacterium]|jgi:GTP-binding protein
MAPRRSPQQKRAEGRRDATGRKGPRKPPAPAPDTRERDERAAPPVVAIVGRPNVGKSTLLNSLVKSRVAIVEETPGVTRDRVAVLCTLADRTVLLVDTGGVGIVDRQGLEEDVEGQVERAIADAAAILFVVDAREGVTPLDERVASLLRRAADRVVLLANKAEVGGLDWNLSEFDRMGYGAPLAISAKERHGLGELEERVEALLPTGPTTPLKLPPPALKLAIVGRVNAGKSSLVNALLRTERMIVSEVPGTTRDSVDVRFEHDGKAMVLIDTAGIRKERVVQDSVDFYAQRRAERAMRRADVSVLVIDATVDIARLDRRIAAYALDHFHPVVVAANKWDLKPPGLTERTFRDYLHEHLPGLRFAPVVFTSAKEGTNLEAVLRAAWALQQQGATRVTTAELNRTLEEAQSLRGPKPRLGRRGQIYYGTQVQVSPPTFILFVNEPELFDNNYLRYLENRFRAALPFTNVPLRLRLRARPRSPSKND